MPITDLPVLALKRIVLECDRCGKSKSIELAVTAEGLVPEGQLEQAVKDEGWQECRHPDSDYANLVFDTRSCMSSWFATFVRVLYGGPAELPKRVVKPKAEPVSPLRSKKEPKVPTLDGKTPLETTI